MYACCIAHRYTNTLLKRVAAGGICYSRSRRCFVSKGVHAFKAEEFTDLRGTYFGEYHFRIFALLPTRR